VTPLSFRQQGQPPLAVAIGQVQSGDESPHSKNAKYRFEIARSPICRLGPALPSLRSSGTLLRTWVDLAARHLVRSFALP